MVTVTHNNRKFVHKQMHPPWNLRETVLIGIFILANNKHYVLNIITVKASSVTESIPPTYKISYKIGKSRILRN